MKNTTEEVPTVHLRFVNGRLQQKWYIVTHKMSIDGSAGWFETANYEWREVEECK